MKHVPAGVVLPARLGRAARRGIRNMVAALTPVIACSPGRACPHSRFRVSDFRFLTSDFQFPLGPPLSTFDFSTFDSSTFLLSCSLTLLESIAMRRAPKRKSSGLKLFGMSKCTARTQKNRPRKCLRMRALQSMWVSSPLESVFAKTWGYAPLRLTVENSEANRNETTAGGSRGLRAVQPPSLSALMGRSSWRSASLRR